MHDVGYMAYIFDFGTYKIRVQEQRNGADIPEYACRLVDASMHDLNSPEHHHSGEVAMMTFSVAPQHTLSVKTTFTGSSERQVDHVDQHVYAYQRDYLSDKVNTLPARRKAIVLNPDVYRGGGASGVILWIKSRPFGIFCKPEHETDTEVDASNIYSPHSYRFQCYRENEKVADSELMLDSLSDLNQKTDYQLKVSEEFMDNSMKNVKLCRDRIQLVLTKLSSMSDANEERQRQEELSRIRHCEKLEHSMKCMQDTMIDSMKAMKKSIVESETAIKMTSFENAMSLKNAIDATNAKLSQVFVERKKSFATEELTVKNFDTQYRV